MVLNLEYLQMLPHYINQSRPAISVIGIVLDIKNSYPDFKDVELLFGGETVKVGRVLVFEVLRVGKEKVGETKDINKNRSKYYKWV